MDCQEFIDRIDDHIDPSSPEALPAEFDQHLGACPYCADYVDSYREAARLLRGSLCTQPEAMLPEALTHQVLRVLGAVPDDGG